MAHRSRAADRIADVEARSASFRRELGPVTLVLTQILTVLVGANAVGVAIYTLGRSRRRQPAESVR